MKLRKQILSATLASTMILSSMSVLAADLDIKNKNDGKVSSFYDVLDDQGLLFGIMDNKSNYLIEVEGKLYDVSQVDAATKDGTSITNAVKNLEPVADAQEKLKVESVSAINQTTIKVTFNGKVTDAAAEKSNFTVSAGTLESAKKISETEVALSVAGLTFDQTLTVTVGNPAFSQEVKIPAINQLYTLEVISDAKDGKNTIKSDGSSMTLLTAKVVEKATGKEVKRDAQIQFSSTLGSLSQPQVALVDGKASTQLRSIASPTSVTSVITAVVASAPGAEQYVGLTGQLIVNFTPDGAVDGSLKMVTALTTGAGADQGDRFFVEFSGDIDAAEYKKVVTNTTTWTGTNYGLEYVNNNGSNQIAIKDVYNITPSKLMFVLDTDSNNNVAPASASAKPGSKMLDENSAVYAVGQKNFLRDNVNHTIKFPANVTGLVVASSEISFMMSDVTKPFIYGVEAKDNMNIEVRASEAIAEDLAEGALNGINDHIEINGQKLRLITNPTAAEILAAKQADELIVTELRVGDYKNLVKDEDTRNKIFIKLHKDFKLAAGNHGIQIANVGDWAGKTDAPQNIVTTQTFPLIVEQDTQIPQATVVAQSPEQWLITFDKPVETESGKSIKDAIKLYTAKGYTATTKQELAISDAIAADDYFITPVDKDGMKLTGKGNSGTGDRYTASNSINGHDKFLVEFKRDWSVMQNGKGNTEDNYWKSGLNPFRVVFNSLESQTGVKVPETVKEITIGYDGTSPEIAGAQDLYVKTPDKDFRSILKADNSRTGKYVYVQMSEPVQLVNANGTAVSNPTTPNFEQDVNADTSGTSGYVNTTGIARPTYRFVKGDDVVIGEVVTGALAEDDTSFVVKPELNKTLSSGTWTLYIEQISDDHGNTSATVSHQVVVPEVKSETDTRVAWIGFDNDNNDGTDDYDYLYVKFSKKMNAYGADGVSETTNYKFRGYDLPQGSTVSKGIDGATKDWDGVTIKMPKTSWEGLPVVPTGKNFSTNVTLASNFKATDGELLSGPHQVELTNHTGVSTADKDGIGANVSNTGNVNKVTAFDPSNPLTTSANAGKLEALYINNKGGSALVAGTPVLYVQAEDTDMDGKYETFEVYLEENNIEAIATTDRYYIGGKAYAVATAVTAGTSNKITLTPVNASDAIASADIGSVKLTNVAGNIIAGYVNVLPIKVTTQAQLNALLLNYTSKNSNNQTVFTGNLLIDAPASTTVNVNDLEVRGTLYLDDNTTGIINLTNVTAADTKLVTVN